MSKFNQFSAENIMMSICGHLVLVAVLVTSATLVLKRAKLVAPDRIQIVEIDLDSVVVSGDETKLYNVGVPDKKSEKTQQKKQENTQKKTKTRNRKNGNKNNNFGRRVKERS